MTELASYLEESFHVQGHYPSFGTVSPIASGSRHSDEISIGADEKHKQSGVVNSKLKSGFVHHPILMIGQSAPTFAEPVKGTSPAVIDELGLYRVDVFLRLSDAPKGIVSEMLADFIDDMPRPEHGVPGQAHTARISAQQSKLPATIFEIGGFSVHKLSEGKGNASQFRAGYIDIAVEDDRDPFLSHSGCRLQEAFEGFLAGNIQFAGGGGVFGAFAGEPVEKSEQSRMGYGSFFGLPIRLFHNRIHCHTSCPLLHYVHVHINCMRPYIGMRTHNTNPHGKETDDVRIIWEKEGKATSGDSRSECQGKTGRLG